MKKLLISKYIKYLRQFDDKIYDNKEEIRMHERKYFRIKYLLISLISNEYINLYSK